MKWTSIWRAFALAGLVGCGPASQTSPVKPTVSVGCDCTNVSAGCLTVCFPPGREPPPDGDLVGPPTTPAQEPLPTPQPVPVPSKPAAKKPVVCDIVGC